MFGKRSLGFPEKFGETLPLGFDQILAERKELLGAAANLKVNSLERLVFCPPSGVPESRRR